MKTLILLLYLGTSSAFAKPGQFAFDWLKVEKSKCTEVVGALEKKIFGKKFKCSPPEAGGSGRMARRCRNVNDKEEFLVFESKEDCNEERETQLANGEG